jgi:hypothetical protein
VHIWAPDGQKTIGWNLIEASILYVHIQKKEFLSDAGDVNDLLNTLD